MSITKSAAMPLTSITAWEIIFDRLMLNKDSKGTILIIGGSGGIGSIAIQLAKKLTKLTVIATSSTPQTVAWCKDLGADYVVNHFDLLNELKKSGFNKVDYIIHANDATDYWPLMAEIIAPEGKICSISSYSKNSQEVDDIFQTKSITIAWELMFIRSLFNTKDMIKQHLLLEKMAKLLDRGEIKSTLKTVLHGFSLNNIKKAYKILRTNHNIGKLVIDFDSA